MFVSWYTLGVSLSVKLAPGILQSYIFQEVYLRVEIQVERFVREILTLFHLGGGGRFCPPSDCLLSNFR